MKIANIKEENLIVYFIATHPGTQDPEEPLIFIKAARIKLLAEKFHCGQV
jgi:hypothetical protein